MYLVKSVYNCADEFDVYGFVLMSSDQWTFFQAIITKAFATMEDKAMEWYVGSNEFIIFESALDVINPLDITWIDDQAQLNTLSEHFGSTYGVEFGRFPDVDMFVERIPEKELELLAEAYKPYSSVYNEFKKYINGE